MDKFYFNALFIRSKLTNIIVLIFEILALPIIALLLYGLEKIFPESPFFVVILSLTLILVLYNSYSYLNGKYNKNCGEYIEFKYNKLYYKTMDKKGEIALNQIKEIVAHYPTDYITMPVEKQVVIYGSYIAIYMDIILVNNHKKKLNFELNCLPFYNKIVNPDIYKTYGYMYSSVVMFQSFLNDQSKKYNFSFKIMNKRFENRWIYLLKLIALFCVFGSAFVLLLPLILFLYDTRNFAEIYTIPLIILSFTALLSGLALRNNLRKFLRRKSVSISNGE